LIKFWLFLRRGVRLHAIISSFSDFEDPPRGPLPFLGPPRDPFAFFGTLFNFWIFSFSEFFENHPKSFENDPQIHFIWCLLIFIGFCAVHKWLICLIWFHLESLYFALDSPRNSIHNGVGNMSESVKSLHLSPFYVHFDVIFSISCVVTYYRMVDICWQKCVQMAHVPQAGCANIFEKI